MPADVDLAAPLLKQADCIILQFEIPLETVYHTIRFARENGSGASSTRRRGSPSTSTEVARIDYFIPNESEAETIGGKPVRTVDDAKACAPYFLEQGIPRVIITLGENGALLAGDGTMRPVPAYAVQTKDTTGAGDAFIGSFATFLAESVPERDAIAQACLYASLSTSQVGTQKSFLARAEFEAHKKGARPRVWARPQGSRDEVPWTSTVFVVALLTWAGAGVRERESHPGR